MISIEEFIDIAGEIIDEIPDVLFKELNGGVIVHEQALLHPERKRDDLFILGEYVRDYTGNTIIIYYGSFMKMYENLETKYLKQEIRKVIRHEMTHHMEGLSGVRDLEIEDEEYLERYLKEE